MRSRIAHARLLQGVAPRAHAADYRLPRAAYSQLCYMQDRTRHHAICCGSFDLSLPRFYSCAWSWSSTVQQPRQRRVFGAVGANDTRGLRPAAAKAGCTLLWIAALYVCIHLFYGPGIARVVRGSQP